MDKSINRGQRFLLMAGFLLFFPRSGNGEDYRIYLNGIKVGKVNVEYDSNPNSDSTYRLVKLNAHVKIIPFFILQSEEKIITDRDFLPHRVERKVNFMGRRETIIERYDQKNGVVDISYYRGPRTFKETIHKPPPIYNSVLLFYVYPSLLKIEKNKIYTFQLPTLKAKVELEGEKIVPTQKGERQIYLLKGWPKRFYIFLDKKTKKPVFIRIITFFGKVDIRNTFFFP